METVVKQPAQPQRLPARLLVFAAALLALGLIALLALRPAPMPVGSISEVDPTQVAALQAAWGIRVTNAALTGGGGIVDIRFQVVDPDKALGLHDPENPPVVIDQASGKVLDKGAGPHGGAALHQSADTFKAGRTYFFLFQNNGSLLQPGSRATLKIGDVLLENVIVQ
jgi:hypothetical protein